MRLGLGLGLGSVGGGGGLSAQTVAYITAMTVKPSAAQELIIDNRIKHLITAGVWDKLYQLCFFDIHNATAALINAVNPAQSCTNYQAVHDVAKGYKSTAGGRYVNSGINLSLIPGAVHTDFSYGVYCSTVSPTIFLSYMAGCTDSVGIQCAFSPAPVALAVRGISCSVEGDFRYTLPSADYSGYFTITRSGALSTEIKCYKKGVELVSVSNAEGSALPNANLAYFAMNNNGNVVSTRINEFIKAVHIGKNLSQPEAKALEDAIALYPWS